MAAPARSHRGWWLSWAPWVLKPPMSPSPLRWSQCSPSPAVPWPRLPSASPPEQQGLQGGEETPAVLAQMSEDRRPGQLSLTSRPQISTPLPLHCASSRRPRGRGRDISEATKRCRVEITATKRPDGSPRHSLMTPMIKYRNLGHFIPKSPPGRRVKSHNTTATGLTDNGISEALLWVFVFFFSVFCFSQFPLQQ